MLFCFRIRDMTIMKRESRKLKISCFIKKSSNKNLGFQLVIVSLIKN